MITINCIGAGRWGPNLVRSFANLPGVEVHLVCDLDKTRLDMISRRNPAIEITESSDDAILDPAADAVVVATPVCTHYDLTRRALESGKHVLVEKPLCKTIEECEELIELAGARELVLAVGHVFLFNAGIRKVRDYIGSGELGRIYYIHAVRTNLGPVREDVNALWDLAAHDLSIFEHWLGASPKSVRATGRRCLGSEREDVVIANFEYPDGILACAYASWLNPQKVREITVVGERKMIVWNDMDLIEPVRVYDKSIDVNPANDYADSFGSFRASIRDGDVLIPHVVSAEPLMAECEHFIECITEGKDPINGASSALEIVGALRAADASLDRDGQAVAIEGHWALCQETVPV